VSQLPELVEYQDLGRDISSFVGGVGIHYLTMKALVKLGIRGGEGFLKSVGQQMAIALGLGIGVQFAEPIIALAGDYLGVMLLDFHRAQSPNHNVKLKPMGATKFRGQFRYFYNKAELFEELGFTCAEYEYALFNSRSRMYECKSDRLIFEENLGHRRGTRIDY
jgi:hypothetical protein